jgi:GTP cyclohydrolase I
VTTQQAIAGDTADSTAGGTARPAGPLTAIGHARALLDLLGVDLSADGLADTPQRMVAALGEMTRGLRLDPDRHLSRTFPPPAATPGLIVAAGVPFTALCEHHMLPFAGTATVGYLPLPGARITGVSKLARLVAEYAARPQIQERIGEQVTAAIDRCLNVDGAACVLRATHTCMTLRGARATGAQMVTSHMTGVFRLQTALRAEFLTLARG